MSVVVWIRQGTWPACVDAARTHTPPEADIVLLHVPGPRHHGTTCDSTARPSERGQAAYDPDAHLEALAAASGEHLLRAAAQRLHRPCTARVRVGSAGVEVMAAAHGADLLIMARPDPHPDESDHAAEFVVDQAPCPVLLVPPTATAHHTDAAGSDGHAPRGGRDSPRRP